MTCPDKDQNRVCHLSCSTAFPFFDPLSEIGLCYVTKTVHFHHYNQTANAANTLFAQICDTRGKTGMINPTGLTITIGTDSNGNTVVCDLEKFHMLIAGKNPEKNELLNSILNGMMTCFDPSELKLIMMTYRVNEFQNCSGMPHLMIPMLYERDKMLATLVWAVSEMNERLRTFSDYDVSSLNEYNSVVCAKDKQMSRIVIFISELAELTIKNKQTTGFYIDLLAKKANAAGIYMVVATQWPSWDVITREIQSLPFYRLAFKASSSIDSRTILGVNGAELLQNDSEVLFKATEQSEPTLIRSTSVYDSDIDELINRIRNECPNTYDETYWETLCKLAAKMEKYGHEKVYPEVANLKTKCRQEFLREVVDFVFRQRQISLYSLKQKFRLGELAARKLFAELKEKQIIESEDDETGISTISTDDWRKMHRLTY